ncbi:Protein prune 2 [Folsomia candida]|uniref:Protein prune 2 n=1 Tax=Folsomia candida TaxID=158441 RepID=A0A226EF33_FOLCA|nr:Protein prune 2 [Folsomia candida]
MADYDFSDISESSYADARADTPTLDGERGSDSEDTLSNLSLDELDNPDDEVLVPPPIPAPRKDRNNHHPPQDDHLSPHPEDDGLSPTSNTASFASALNGSVRVCVTDADLAMADSLIDFPKSPSQLKILKGPSFMPKEEPGVVSEDESSVSSYQAHVDDVNGQVRLVKKDSLKPNFVIPAINLDQVGLSPPDDQSGSSSYLSVSHENDPNALDDYIEDFILPMSHESVMSRQLSFRRQVRRTYDKIAADKATQELDKFEAMLSTYDEEDEINRSLTPENNNNYNKTSTPIPKARNTMKKSEIVTPLKPNFDLLEPQSLLDIDAIVCENAPDLMSILPRRKGSHNDATGPPTLSVSNSTSDLESLSNYFLPQETIDKLYAVYESSNFNNIYCLSGEIKNILSPIEIEEILDNKDRLERFIDPNVMAALSWSLNPASLPSPINNRSNNNDVGNNKIPPKSDDGGGLKSKSSSMSNGFHSDASSSCDDDTHSTSSNSTPKTEPADFDDEGKGGSESGIESPSPTSDLLQRATPLTASMRRRIALSKGIRTPSLDDARTTTHEDDDDDMDEVDLGVGDEDWEDDDNSNSRTTSNNSNGTCLVRSDSKRFSFKGKDGQVIAVDRVVEGVFVESMNSNPKGTLRRVKVPLNLSSEDPDELEMSSPEPTSLIRVDNNQTNNPASSSSSSSQVKPPKQPAHNRRKISVDENILSMISSTEFDDGLGVGVGGGSGGGAGGDDASQATTASDIFYSIRNSTLNNDDENTMRTENGVDDDEITLDLDTPDDMEDSIMGQLESIATSHKPDGIPNLPRDEDEIDASMRWKPYRVGPADVQIDLQAIQPYRKCLSHGGYFDAEKNVAIILFSGCNLPDRSQKDYTYLMDHLFLYVLSTLEELIVEDYILVYLHGATPKSASPTWAWLKKCYQLINHRLRKNLKGIYLVHPTFWLRTVVALTRPFVSTKFSRKIRFVYTLSDLCLEIPTEHLVIPDSVLQYDFDLKVDDLKKRKLLS